MDDSGNGCSSHDSRAGVDGCRRSSRSSSFNSDGGASATAIIADAPTQPAHRPQPKQPGSELTSSASSALPESPTRAFLAAEAGRSVDPDSFQALPASIQHELVQAWQRSTGASTSASASATTTRAGRTIAQGEGKPRRKRARTAAARGSGSGSGRVRHGSHGAIERFFAPQRQQ